MNFFKTFNYSHIDVLQEIGNIGSGNAATSLSELIGQKVNINFPITQITKFDKACQFIKGEEQVVFAVLFRIIGEIEGNLFFFLEEESVYKMLSYVTNFNVEKEKELSEYDLSVLKEVGNILSGAYVSSLSNLTELNISMSTPEIQHDMVGAILSFGLMEYSIIGNDALLIQTSFAQEEINLKGHFVFFPSPHSLKPLFSKLGINL